MICYMVAHPVCIYILIYKLLLRSFVKTVKAFSSTFFRSVYAHVIKIKSSIKMYMCTVKCIESCTRLTFLISMCRNTLSSTTLLKEKHCWPITVKVLLFTQITGSGQNLRERDKVLAWTQNRLHGPHPANL